MMRALRDNRYIYRIYKKSREGAIPFLKSLWDFFAHHATHRWDYLDEIEQQNFIYENENIGGKIYLPYLRIDAIQKLIVRNENYYEREILDVLRTYLPACATILDVGANIGNHTLFFALICHAEKIFAFEPVADTFAILQKNIALNRLETVVTVTQAGVGDIGMTRANIRNYDSKNIGGTSIEENPHGDIPIIALDEYNFSRKIDFIKIDTEGFELNVLRGGMNLIRRDRPVIFCEIDPENKEVVSSLLTNLGYICKIAFGEKDYLYVPEG